MEQRCLYAKIYININIAFWLSWVSVRNLVFNATFNNISGIPWRSVLLVEVKTTDLPQVTDKLNQIMLYQVHLA